jgi:hypothetical protein
VTLGQHAALLPGEDPADDPDHDNAKEAGTGAANAVGASTIVSPIPSPRGESFLAAYEQYGGTAVPALEASNEELFDAILRIVKVEGPILGDRLIRAYVKASGGERAGRLIRTCLNRTITAAVRRRLIIEDNPLSAAGIKYRTYRLATQPQVYPRTLGPRRLEQVPPAELAALVRHVCDASTVADDNALYRAALAEVGLRRQTPSARAALDRVRSLV